MYQKHDKEAILKSLNSIVGLCYDDRSHELDFYRKNGLSWIVSIINFELDNHQIHHNQVLICAIRILSSASTHKENLYCNPSYLKTMSSYINQ